MEFELERTRIHIGAQIVSVSVEPAETRFPKFFDIDEPFADTVIVVVCVLGYRSYILAPGSLFVFTFEALEVGVTYVR